MDAEERLRPASLNGDVETCIALGCFDDRAPARLPLPEPARELGWIPTFFRVPRARPTATRVLQAVDTGGCHPRLLGISREGSAWDPPRRCEISRGSGFVRAARSELVAGGGASDRSPNQPAPAQREPRKHVPAVVAPRPGRGSRSVVRSSLRKAPDPHRHPTSSEAEAPSLLARGLPACCDSMIVGDGPGVVAGANPRPPA
jgi:hypothetical protein